MVSSALCRNTLILGLVTLIHAKKCSSFFSGWINVGDLQGAVHFKIVKYERIKFLVIALRESIEIYAWAPKPYHKFMAFKSFSELQHRPLLVDLTVEEGTRLKVRKVEQTYTQWGSEYRAGPSNKRVWCLDGLISFK